MKKSLLKYLALTGLVLSLYTPSTHAAKLALSPGSATLKAGCLNVANIIINTEGEASNAADAFLNYNPNEIEIVDQIGSIAGTQLGIGRVYQAYPGNFADNGVIRLTAFNDSGSFNGRGVLATIAFRSKPGVQSSSINFNYTLGGTTDSNVAALDASDLLNGAYGATYTFEEGRCTTDTKPPWIEEGVPKNGDIGVPYDTEISFIIKDNESGVDIDSLEVQINDLVYTKNSPELILEKKGLSYEAKIKPVNPFGMEPVHISIRAKDHNDNVMTEYQYGFNLLIKADQCPALEDLRPAADEPPFLNKGWLIFLLILLIFSLLLNVYQWTHIHRFVGKMKMKIHEIRNK